MKTNNIKGFVAVSAALVVVAIMLIFALVSSTYFSHPRKAEAAGSVRISGWAWGEAYTDTNGNGIEDAGESSYAAGTQGGIGWISLTCDHASDGTLAPNNTNTCGTVNYGLQIDSSTGAITGTAWSENFGWISANPADLAGCPSGTCTASMSGNNMTGWLKVLSANDAQAGGWDGFIALGDTDTLDAINYGVTLNVSGSFSGYAWGSSNVGWVDFSLAKTTYGTCTAGTAYTCPGPGTQTLRRTDTDVTCATTVTDTTCVAPQFCSAGQPTCATPLPTGFPSGTLTGNLTIKPNLVPKNATTTLYWGIVNVQPGSCTLSANDSSILPVWAGEFSATSTCSDKYTSSAGTGCNTPAISQSTMYTLSCLKFDNTQFKQTATVNIVPDYQEK
jgi:hypothetical protein